uniref:Beta-catenin-like protein 1 n=1 Tax=Meloidogyne javanica TaxID=6303 RepID=A0A915LKU6_MELJA
MSTIHVDEILKLPSQPPEKRPRLAEFNHDEIKTTKNAIEILESTDDEAQEEIDEAAIKRLCLQLERKQAKNAETRVKYPDDPRKFMESEVELNTAIQEMHVIAAEPQFYSILVEQGSLQILLQLLSHENADIVGAVCNLLQELTDVEILVESEDCANLLIEELLKGQIVETLVQQVLGRLNEGEQDEADAIHNALTIIENLLDFRPEANEICVSQGLFEWLMIRGTKKGAFDANKLFASQLLHMLLQSSASARIKLTEKRDGVDLLLRALATFKKHDPSSPDEYEHMENLFDALCASLMHAPNRQVFLDGEGLQLMNLMLMEKKQSREGALKVLSHATAIPDGTANCDKFVEILGLRTLFPLLMRTPPKMKRKDTTPDDHEEYCCSIIDALLFSCNQTNKNRVLSKFADHCFEKIDRMVELYIKYSEKLRKFEVKFEKRLAEMHKDVKPDEEEIYIEKLNNGLYTLQRIVLILAEVCIKGAPGSKERAEKLFKMRFKGAHLNTLLESILTEFYDSLDPEANDQKERVEHLIACLSAS